MHLPCGLLHVVGKPTKIRVIVRRGRCGRERVVIVLSFVVNLSRTRAERATGEGRRQVDTTRTLSFSPLYNSNIHCRHSKTPRLPLPHSPTRPHTRRPILGLTRTTFCALCSLRVPAHCTEYRRLVSGSCYLLPALSISIFPSPSIHLPHGGSCCVPRTGPVP